MWADDEDMHKGTGLCELKDVAITKETTKKKRQ